MHNGDLIITKAGTTIDSLDVRGTIQVKADNVTITRTFVRGGPKATRTSALISAWWKYRNLTVTDSTLAATNQSLHIDGLSGSNFTAKRLNISQVVDPIKIIGPNVSVSRSWLHDTIHSSSDPNQPDGRTHDDSVQLEGGSNIVIEGNTLEDAHNAAIQITQNYSITANVRIQGNWLRDGVCTINVTQASRGPILAMSILNNQFGPGAEDRRCPMLLPRASAIALTGNVWEGATSLVVPRIF